VFNQLIKSIVILTQFYLVETKMMSINLSVNLCIVSKLKTTFHCLYDKYDQISVIP